MSTTERITINKERVRSNPDDLDAHYKLVQAYETLGRNKEVIKEYKEIIRIKPIDHFAHYKLGSTFSKLGKHNEAISSLKEMMRIDPDSFFSLDARFILADSYEKLGHAKEAVGEYIEILKMTSKDQNRTSFNRARKRLKDLEQKIAQAEPAPPVSQTTPEPSERKPVPGGTGFLFSAKDYIITNYHVVKGKQAIKAKFTNGDVIEANIISKDVKNDIAILELKTSSSIESRELQFGDSSKTRMGEKVFTIGFPASFVLGERPKYTDGVISAVTGIRDDPTVFQITVPIQPGNSGGPLFNQRGEVIGITTSSLSLRATEVLGAIPQNINYALKSSFVKNLLASIPEALLSNRGIVVVPKDPENSLADFIEAVTGNVVLIEANE